jgi:transcriptional antiterminator RfaH
MLARIEVDTKADDGLTIPHRGVSGAHRTPDCGSHSGFRWYCIQHKPGQLHIAEANLGVQGFETWYPLRRDTHRRGRKVEQVLRPVFTGFVFIRFDADCQRWRPIVSTRGVSKLFSVSSERPLPIARGIVERLQAEQVETGFLARPVDSLIKAGAFVRISNVANPFHNQEALVLKVQGATVHIEATLFGRSMPLALPARDVVVARSVDK